MTSKKGEFLSVLWARWGDESQYKYTKELSYFGWAWEFLRRNKQYCDEYFKLNNERYTEEIRDDRAKSWGLSNGFIEPELNGLFVMKISSMLVFDLMTCVACGNLGNLRSRSNEEHKRTITMRDGQIAILFDLLSPIQSQVDYINKFLKETQKSFLKMGHIKLQNVKRHEKNWPEYLRLLDGRASGASFREIGEAIYPGNADPRDRAQKAYKAAKAISDYGYREIALIRTEK